ncbi:MocR-like pyridoxine biosynthesis transcription factor PdxR, partial [Leucobacter sp. M11]|uniref:MocR-like pyridoxine biosynthesis transcription factor PdxR n=1 Tax=Leucobacter sp. M11 TaxID=2993565 RepID=UPI002D7F0956
SAGIRDAFPPVSLRRGGERPLPAQLVEQLRQAIDHGTLRPGERLPATRALAERLGVSRGTVLTAYDQLIAEGYLTAVQGRGTEVNARLGDAARRLPALPPVPREPEPRSGGSATQGPLSPGAPLTDTVDSPAWRAAWREAARSAHGPVPPAGDERLRAEIAEHLRRMRGTDRPARDITVTAGARDGLGLLLTALGSSRGHRVTVGVENPGYPSLRGVAQRHGAEIVALPVDEQGLDPAALPKHGLQLLIVTPSHQYPLGGSLSLERRRDLLDWAARSGVIIVEDDYDSELRESGAPLPALAALDDPANGVVATLGTFSKTVSPALATGFLLTPPPLSALVRPVREQLGSPVSGITQQALASYLSSGELRRHTVRMRRRYRERRAAVLRALAGIPGVRARPMSGGLHAVITLGIDAAPAEQGRAEERVLAASDAAGLGARGLAGYWQHTPEPGAERGLVIGLGGPDEIAFHAALRALAALCRADARDQE